MFGVAIVCFSLVHLAPGDPLVSVLPPDASAELQKQLRTLYGFDRSLPEQFLSWISRAVTGRSRHVDCQLALSDHRGDEVR